MRYQRYLSHQSHHIAFSGCYAFFRMKDLDLVKDFNSGSPLRYIRVENSHTFIEKIQLRVDRAEWPKNVTRIKEIIHEEYLKFKKRKIEALENEIKARQLLANSKLEEQKLYPYYYIESVEASVIYD